MVVRTQAERLKQLRRGVMELCISDHPLDCLTGAANRDWELQEQAGAEGLRDVRYGYHGATNMGQPKDQSNPYFDPSKCIVCSRCVRACQELQGTFALTIEDKGFDRRWPPRREKTSSAQNVFPAALVFRPARQRPSSKRSRRDRHARSRRRHHLRLLWSWLHFPRGNAGRGTDWKFGRRRRG